MGKTGPGRDVQDMAVPAASDRAGQGRAVSDMTGRGQKRSVSDGQG